MTWVILTKILMNIIRIKNAKKYDEFNLNKKRKTLILFHDVIADTFSHKKQN